MSASHFAAWLLLALPASMLAFAFLPRSLVSARASQVIGAATFLSVIALLVAALMPLALLAGSPLSREVVGFGPFRVGVYFDALSALLLGLIAFIGAIVMRYAKTYLAGDPGIGRFFKWLCTTTGAALLLVVAGNLVLFFLAWMAMSLSLHKLLTFYGDRPAARLAARKKFLVSRLGDACLLGAIALTYHAFRSWDFADLFVGARAMAAQGGGHGHSLELIAFLLVGGAMLKSAQFPFHSWLPDTMETPTPVSALMHAGIINAGGFLVIRLSPLIILTPAALDVLAVVGAFTAIFAAVVMTTQTSVKRSLAFSTIAQMGFMMLQCGLGAFSVAALHIVAHSLYKAHAFLSSGSVVGSPKGELVMPAKREENLGLSLGAFLVSLALTLGMAHLFGVSAQNEPGALLLGAVLLLALTSLLRGAWSQPTPAMLGLGVAICAGVSALYFALHLAFAHLLSSSVAQLTPRHNAAEIALFVGVAALSGVVLFAPQLSVLLARSRALRAFYVHAQNGFYIHTLANRLVKSS